MDIAIKSIFGQEENITMLDIPGEVLAIESSKNDSISITFTYKALEMISKALEIEGYSYEKEGNTLKLNTRKYKVSIYTQYH